MSVPHSLTDQTLEEVCTAIRDLDANVRRHIQARDADAMVIPGKPSIPARLYRPVSQTALPLLVYFHAGGWAMGDAL